jgi:AAA15 family ATPase/GTPase
MSHFKQAFFSCQVPLTLLCRKSLKIFIKMAHPMSFSLVEFKFHNFRCFRDEQCLSLVSTGRGKHLYTNTFSPLKSTKSFKLVNTAVVYGANASGKTSVFDALYVFIDTVAKSHRENTGEKTYRIVPFSLDKSMKNEPTGMQITYVVDGVRYNYGFSYLNGEFIEEWLYGYPNSKSVEYFYRKKGEKIRFSDYLKGKKRVLENLTRNDSLFLSAAAMNGHVYLGEVYDHICNSITFAHNDALRNIELLVGRALLKEEKLKPFIIDLLKEASSGVEDIEVVESKIDDERWEKIREALKPDAIEKISESFINKKTLNFSFFHRGKDGELHSFRIFDESSGTRKIFALSSLIAEVIENGHILIVDELDAQIHELMALSILEMFRSPSINKNCAQLVFNTHNSGFLKSNLFRKDQIWFTEKDQGGNATLYPLTDFESRKNDNLAKGYLQGIYGAVPWRGQFKF